MADPNEALVVTTTLPSRDQAAALARALVDERLAACVQIVDGLRSIYRWQGQICDEPEVLCLIKTARARWEALRARVAELHPYDVPELLALPVAAGSAPYLDWLLAETAG